MQMAALNERELVDTWLQLRGTGSYQAYKDMFLEVMVYSQWYELHRRREGGAWTAGVSSDPMVYEPGGMSSDNWVLALT